MTAADHTHVPLIARLTAALGGDTVVAAAVVVAYGIARQNDGDSDEIDLEDIWS